MRVSFRLNIVPPKSTAQTQRRLAVIGGKARMFTSAKGKAMEQSLESLLMPHAPPRPLQGPVRACYVIVWPWRASEPKKRRALGSVWMITKPDDLNFCKMLDDALETCRFFENDSQICDRTVQKWWGDDPRISIELEEIE